MSKFINYRFRNFLLLFAIIFGSLSSTFSILYYGLKWRYPIATLYRMYAYHNEHSFQYIAIVAGFFGIVGVYWIDYYRTATGYLRWRTMTVAMMITLVIASPFGGMLWQIHDMQHGFIPDYYPAKIFQGMIWGFEYGWLIAILSFPMNLVGLTTGYATLHWLSKLSKYHR